MRIYIKRPLSDRFWGKVDKSGDCWLWTASVCNSGYGQVCSGVTGGGMLMTHRVAWELSYGDIPQGMFVCHHCDVKRCVNPAHLFLGTPADNTHDMHSKGRAMMGDRHTARLDPSYLPRGSSHKNSRLTESNVSEIRRRYAVGGISHMTLALEYGVTEMTISAAVHRRTWKHVVD